ncbi:hypothetical protein [Dickeya lacustris]|uniref:Uncharacterized protein n=1 Tax=Dickeya lacustris TaxID=2259638 RepID=A0ABY8GAU9_9GAMM|nr:hypothetical protein [Dickeya lacustris]WFN57037.1 hypothetical protein O1Q98_07415 [Dickeya lacustris]
MMNHPLSCIYSSPGTGEKGWRVLAGSMRRTGHSLAYGGLSRLCQVVMAAWYVAGGGR